MCLLSRPCGELTRPHGEQTGSHDELIGSNGEQTGAHGLSGSDSDLLILAEIFFHCNEGNISLG